MCYNTIKAKDLKKTQVKQIVYYKNVEVFYMLTNSRYTLKKIVTAITSAAVLAATVFAPVSSAGAKQVPDNQLNEMAIEVAFLVNEFRAENGLHPVYVLPYLCDKSRERAREIMWTWSHNRPDGSKFSSILDGNLVSYDTVFENIAAGRDDPADVVEDWKNSPAHREAMLNPNLTHMGVGVGYEQNADYEWYWQEMFIISQDHYANEYIPSRHIIEPKAEGDLTGDAEIDIYDYLTVADYLYKKKQNIPVYLNDAQLETADAFRDGIITEADAKVLARYILGEYSKLPYVF